MVTLILALLAAVQAPAAAAPPVPPPAPATQAPVRRATTPTTLEVRVTDRTGKPVASTRVSAEGPVGRDGLTDTSGAVSFRGLPPGLYRLHAEGEGLVALEREVTLRSGVTPPLEMALSRAVTASAPEPAEAPPVVAPPSLAPQPDVVAGEPRVVSLLDVAENSLGGKEPVRTVPVGCSGLGRAQILVVRDSLPVASRADADDMLYVIAGEASISLAGKTQSISSGWFSIVPRGVSRTVIRKGKNPVILLSIVGGPACTSSSTQ